eukprot:TRINITY_DN38610_c0_g1_i1.p1 TRINITY_DN38610_c0_g1~~TRINITY_DN38610_c0_g1_i1.p1  ORF type:complete len:135 (+),score=3.94 TRINITY_DN38610_c0_g1_i1:100-504(+)
MNDYTHPPNFCGRCGMSWSRDSSVVFCTQCGWNSRGCGPPGPPAVVQSCSPDRGGYPPAPQRPDSIPRYREYSQQRQHHHNSQHHYESANRKISTRDGRKAGVEYPIGDSLHCAPVAPWDVSEVQTPIRKKFVY